MREEKIGLSFCLLLSNQNFKQKIKWVEVNGCDVESCYGNRLKCVAVHPTEPHALFIVF